MIHAIGTEIQAAIQAQGCPFDVVDGPEPTNTVTWARERIVIERDLEGGDRFGSVRSQRANPKHVATRAIGVKITIYAKSPNANAFHFEHQERADDVLDFVLVALLKVARARRNEFAVVGGKFIEPDDLAKSERPAGAAYELAITFDRGVYDRTWAGAIAPEAPIASGMIKSTTKVSLENGPGDDGDPATIPAGAETACG